MDEEVGAEWLNVVDAVIKQWSEFTTPIFVNEESASGKFKKVVRSEGTGFFVEYKGIQFLVTAAHVAKTFKDGMYYAARTRDKVFLLNGLHFFLCAENDLAVAPMLSDWLAAAEVFFVPSFKIEEEMLGFEPLGHWVSIGYPKSKNGINPGLGRLGVNVYGASFTEKVMRPKAKFHISDPLVFKFDKKSTVDSDAKKTNPPSFSGTSGSPVFQIMAKYDHGVLSICCELEGVFLGWDHRERELAVGRVGGLVRLMDTLVLELAEID